LPIKKINPSFTQIHFFTFGGFPTFVSSCEFNGLVSKSRRIPPAALFLFNQYLISTLFQNFRNCPIFSIFTFYFRLNTEQCQKPDQLFFVSNADMKVPNGRANVPRAAHGILLWKKLCSAAKKAKLK
jgi:hypothetical protein